jgi:hypothetical protein
LESILGESGGGSPVANTPGPESRVAPPVAQPRQGVDGFLFSPSLPIAERVFAGTVDQFTAAVPALLAKAVATMGLKPDDYAGAADAIIAATRACGRITPHLAFVASDGGGYGREHVEQLGPEYQVCAPSLGTQVYNPVGQTAGRAVLIGFAPGKGAWRSARGFEIRIWLSALDSDRPPVSRDQFHIYGLLSARIEQPESGCAAAAGRPFPPDRLWREDGTNLFFRVWFECDRAIIFNQGDGLVADLQLHGDKYTGTGNFSPCPGGGGKVEIRKWSQTRIDAKVQFPNSVTHECGGLKQGYVLAATLHINMSDVTLVPR